MWISRYCLSSSRDGSSDSNTDIQAVANQKTQAKVVINEVSVIRSANHAQYLLIDALQKNINGVGYREAARVCRSNPISSEQYLLSSARPLMTWLTDLISNATTLTQRRIAIWWSLHQQRRLSTSALSESMKDSPSTLPIPSIRAWGLNWARSRRPRTIRQCSAL